MRIYGVKTFLNNILNEVIVLRLISSIFDLAVDIKQLLAVVLMRHGQ
jgi:hypothetical protein